MGEGAASSRSTSIRNLRSLETLDRYRRKGLQRAAYPRDEQRDGQTGFHDLTVRCKPEWNGHEPVIQRDVKQSFAVGSPAHLSAAIGGNRHFASSVSA